MKEGWKEYELRDLSDVINRGITPKYVYENGYLVINQKCIRNNLLSFTEARLTSKEKKITPNKIVNIGDILVNSTGTGTLGRTAFVKKLSVGITTVDTHVTIVRPNKLVDNKFLGYSLGFKEPQIENYAKGATNQQELGRDDLGLLRILLPPLPTQHRIAKILSAYDDLIENNLKRIKLLEEMGQKTYEEWFVRFKFPGYETAIFDKETGLPEGWKKKPITSFLSFKQDKSKVTSFLNTKIYFATADIDGTKITSKGEIITWENKPTRAQISPKNNTVWFARMSDTYKVLCFNKKNIDLQKNSVLSSGFAGFKAINELCLPFLYFTINSIFFHEMKNIYATGATQVSLNNESMRFMIIQEPTLEIVENYGVEILPLIEEISLLIKQNEILKEARDILLPRLMTGMIDVDRMNN